MKHPIQLAQEAIDREDIEVYDICAEMGQQFDNIKHMKWFVRHVAEELYPMQTSITPTRSSHDEYNVCQTNG